MRKRLMAINVLAIMVIMAILAAGGRSAQAATEAKGKKPSLETEISQVRLTAESLKKLVDAEHALAAAKESDTDLMRAIALHPSEEARTEWVRRIQSRPKAVEAMKSAGLSPREYLLTAAAVARAYAVAAQKKRGKPVSKEFLDKAPVANVAFVESHLSAVEAWQTRTVTQPGPNTLEDIYSPPPPPPAPAPPPKKKK